MSNFDKSRIPPELHNTGQGTKWFSQNCESNKINEFSKQLGYKKPLKPFVL